MSRFLAALYGVAVYLVFLPTFAYAILFIANLYVPKTIDSGPVGPLVPSLLIDAALLGIFAVQHSVMARPAFKRWWTRFVPHSIERSTFVLFSSLALILLIWQWRPIPTVVWSVTAPGAVLALQVLSWVGWAILLTSTFLLNHFELFGLQQVYSRLTGRTQSAPEFRTPLFYRYVRHPLYLGFVIAFWSAPTMTVGHLWFSAACTGYILIGIWLEERDLVALFGDQYRRYREQVSMLVPLRFGARRAGKTLPMAPGSNMVDR
jgi:methanethiol S-methyltransferase